MRWSALLGFPASAGSFRLKAGLQTINNAIIPTAPVLLLDDVTAADN